MHKTHLPPKSPFATAPASPSYAGFRLPPVNGDLGQEDERGLFKRLGFRLKDMWKRHQYREIQKSIRAYSFEKHVLSRSFRPVADWGTVRRALGQIERNKLPFHADCGRPWLGMPPCAPVRQPLPQPENLFLPPSPPSLSHGRDAGRKDAVRDDSPIILIT